MWFGHRSLKCHAHAFRYFNYINWKPIQNKIHPNERSWKLKMCQSSCKNMGKSVPFEYFMSWKIVIDVMCFGAVDIVLTKKIRLYLSSVFCVYPFFFFFFNYLLFLIAAGIYKSVVTIQEVPRISRGFIFPIYIKSNLFQTDRNEPNRSKPNTTRVWHNTFIASTHIYIYICKFHHNLFERDFYLINSFKYIKIEFVLRLPIACGKQSPNNITIIMNRKTFSSGKFNHAY